MRNFVKTLVAAAALAGTAVAAHATDIIVVSHGQANDPFWSVVKNGVAQAAKDMGVNAEYRAPQTFDMVQMGQLIDAAVNQQPDGLVVSIPDADALGPSIKRAVAAGIPVISMNSGSDVSKELGALLHVGQDEYTAGKIGGEKLKEMGGKVGLCVNHEVGNVSLDQRCKGFADGFGGKVTVLPTSNDPSDIKAKISGAINSNPDIDTIMCLGAPLAGMPAVNAVKESGKSGKINIGCFDLAPDYLQAVANGEAAFAIDQQQYLQGYLPVVFLALNAKYGLMPASDVASGPNLVTKDKAEMAIDLSKKGIR
jgi:simple sugar transport system substrate-binding protein